MSNFKGYLIKIGGIVLPNSFIEKDGWHTYPNQRIDVDSYRDASANGMLHREALGAYKTKIELTIRELKMDEMEAFASVVKLASLGNERKVSLEYWNDETLSYSTGTFYIPNYERTISYVNDDGTEMEYKSFKLTFIEY